MKRILLVFLTFSLLINFTQSSSYSQQLAEQNDGVKSKEEYLTYEGANISQMPNMFSASLRMITVLLVLLALFLSFIFFLKRFQQRKGLQHQGPISVLFRLPLGAKESICLVDVMGEILVLGVTSAQVSFLFKVEDADARESLTESQTYSGHQFQHHLKSEQENVKVATVLESLRTLRDRLRKV
jgi:flagellar biosynthetic protein FliO